MSKSKSILSAALVVGLITVGCGGVQQDDVEIKQGNAVGGVTLGKYVANGPSQENYIQQVPIGTDIATDLTGEHGRFFTYPQLPTMTMQTGANVNSPLPAGQLHSNNAQLVFTTVGATDPAITGTVSIGEILGPNWTPDNFMRNVGHDLNSGALTGYFKQPYSDYASHPDFTQSTVFNDSGVYSLHAAGGSWTHVPRHIYGTAVWPTHPYNLGLSKTTPSTIYLRIDIDFPEFGVTNRYLTTWHWVSAS